MVTWKQQVEPIVMHEWTRDEYKQLSPFQFYRILFIQFLYYRGLSYLFSKDFYSVVFGKKRYFKDTTFWKDRVFSICYCLHFIMIVDGGICAFTPFKS